MTDSQFETLRQELRAMRSDFDQRFDAVSQRFDAVSQRFDGVSKQFDSVGERFDGIATRLTKLDVQLDSKPDKAFVFQTLLTVNATFIALVGLGFLLPV